MTHDELAALAPCPFCDSPQMMVCNSPYLANEGGRAYAVSCTTYDCHGLIYALGYGLFRTEAEAIAAWNKRAPSDQLQALIDENERLREANGILEDALQEVGDDYPGSSCQEWCQQQVKAARAALNPPQPVPAPSPAD